MRTTNLTGLFFLFMAGGVLLPAESGFSSYSPAEEKITFNFQAHGLTVFQKSSVSIDTTELKKSNWYSQVIKTIEESEYEISQDTDKIRYTSPNRKQNLRAFYTPDKFILRPRNDSSGQWNLSLHLEGIYADKQVLCQPLQSSVAEQKHNTIRFNHSDQFTVEYINSKEGVRQNFIIHKCPGRSSVIKIQQSAGKNWYINKVHDRELHFAKIEEDRPAKKITYNGLKAWDANKKELEAWFTVNETHTSFSIDVDAVDAVYPVTIDPISTGTAGSADWIGGDANQPNARYGINVASAGDVNGDGYSDVIVGAYLFDDGGNTDEGRAFVYHGSATGLSSTPNSILDDADQAGAQFGVVVNTAGDVNGDGYSDVIVAAHLYDDGLNTDEGRAFVYHGSATGLSASPVSLLDDIDQASSFLGYVNAASTAGDVNGDGYSDVIVGAQLYDDGPNMSEGRALVYYGSASGLSASPDVILNNADQSFANFGSGVASAGDVNGDGYSDVIVGAQFYDDGAITNEGVAFVYYGSAAGLSAIPATMLDDGNLSGSAFGFVVNSAGDVNGDGYSDVIIGAYSYTDGPNNGEGRAFIYHGSATGLSATPDNIIDDADQGGAGLGIRAASAGDVNGDGYNDVIAGVYQYDDGANTNEGQAYIYFGSASGLSASPGAIIDDADQANAGLGSGATSAGDVNGDGYSDIIVGAWLYDDAGNTDEGAAFVYHGGPDGLKTTSNWQTLETQVGANYGLSVASAGDVNSDGFSDVLVGAYIFDQGSGDEGKAYLYLGSATGLSTTAAWTATGSMAQEYFGRCVASAGDVNGDGYGDVLIGAYGYSNMQSQEGRIYLYYGSSGGLSGTAAWSYENNVATSVLGVSVAAAGDVNGDGYGDIITGGPQYMNGEINEGIAYLFYGTSTVPASTANWSVEGNQAGAFFGVSVAGLGDANGDGYCDVIIGANTYDNGFTDEGQAFVYYGSAAGLPTTADWTAKGNQLNAQFGNSVSSAGDVNGDGYSDALIGAFSYDDGTTDEGAAFVYYGSSTGLSTAADWTGENNLSNTLFAYSVCSAGDVNGDGYSDVLVGARNYSNGQTNEGALYAYYGSSTGLPLTSSWFVESNITGTLFGNSVASAGDVNGDGYSDVIAGAPYYANPTFREGAAFVYYGNNNTGLRHNLRLYNQDLVTPIQQSSIGPALFGAGLYTKSPLGRQKGKLVWETVNNGQPFSGNPITNSTSFLSQQASFTDLGLLGVELKNQIAKEFNTKATYIRARVKYDPVTAITGQVYGPWRYPESFLRGNRDIGAVVLPVKFLAFTAVKQNDHVWLKWITADETPGIRYEIMHSRDGINFNVIGNVAGLNNSRNEYEWIHTNPATGNNFYRIRAVENSRQTVSATRQVYFGKNGLITAYPNPAKSGSAITVELANNTTTGALLVELFSINGQKKANWSIVQSNSNITVTLPQVSAGQYILSVIKENEVIGSTTFVVEK